MENYPRRSFLKTALLGSLLAVGGMITGSKGTAENNFLNTMPVVTVGFLGCAHIHVKDYVSYINQHKNIRVLKVWDNEEKRAKKIAQELNASFAHSIEEICQNPHIQVVIVASETHLHFQLLQEIIKAKKHIFVEKPLAISAQEAFQIVKLLKDYKPQFHCNYFYRTLPALVELRKLVKDKLVGEIIHARVSLTHRGILEGWFEDCPWMLEANKAGMGGFGDEGTHAIDLATWVLGAQPSQVFAKLNQSEDKKIDIFGEALLFYPTGVMCNLVAGWNCELDHTYISVSGTKGTIYVNNNSLYYQLSHQNDQLINRIDITPLPPKAEAGLDCFFDVLLGKRQTPLISANEAAKNVWLIEKLYASAKKISVEML